MKSQTTLMLLLALMAGAQAQDTPQIDSDVGAREAMALTVYNSDLALVKDRRQVKLPRGESLLSWREVSSQIRPETALLQAVTGHPVKLIEQNFDFDLLTPQKLLDKYVGQDVTVLRPNAHDGSEQREKATVLSTQEGTVLRFADRIETGAPGRIVFDKVPPSLRERPTLSMLLDAVGGAQSLELSYLTGGLGWQADYVAHLSPDAKQLDLSGWITLDNRSGVAYQNARLQLVAGSVHRAPQAAPTPIMARVALAALSQADATQEALLDYHLYSINRPTSIANNQSKQIALLSANQVPVRREYLLASARADGRESADAGVRKYKPAVYLEFDNRSPALGQPLSAGVVRVYARDSQGAAQFVGEDRIAHSARNELVRLRLGEAFDINAERRQTDFRRLGSNSSESSYRIELRNAKSESVRVKVQEPFFGEWEILRASQHASKDSAQSASWQIDVPAQGSAVLEYSVRTRW